MSISYSDEAFSKPFLHFSFVESCFGYEEDHDNDVASSSSLNVTDLLCLHDVTSRVGYSEM